MPLRSRASILSIRSTERLKPIARRSSSASPPVKPAAVIAMRSSCSWKSGTPSVRSRIGSQRLVRIVDGLAAGAAVQVGMHHLADDRAGADDRDLDDEVVEVRGLQPRERRHLRAALDLEDADRVGAAHHRVGLGVVGRELREIDRDALVARDRAGASPRARASMPRPSRSILMMPRSAQSSLSHCTIRRPAIVAGSIGTTSSRRPAAITIPPAVLAEMARQALHRVDQIDPVADAGRLGIELASRRRASNSGSPLRPRGREVEAADELREPIDRLGREAEHLAHLADGELDR